MKHQRLRKIKNKKHNILCSIKGNRKKKKANKKRRNSSSYLRRTSFNTQQHVYRGKSISLTDTKSGNSFHPMLLLEYSNVYPWPKLDLIDEIKKFPREMLIKMILVLGRNFGKCLISEMDKHPFFSYLSEYSKERMGYVFNYIRREGKSPSCVSYSSTRTLLEFLKLTFGVLPKEQSGIYPDYIAEAKVFDLLLAINEQKVTPYVTNKRKNDLARMMYASLYATNEFTNFDEKLALSEQMYYAKVFFDFITSREEYKHVYEKFLEKFDIEKWQDYYLTIAALSALALKEGVGVLDIKKHDEDHLFTLSVVNTISVSQHDYIEINEEIGDNNRDFAIFRARPLIHMESSQYMLYNKPLIIDRLYNSIYFDLMPYKLKYKEKSYSQFYKEVFVEKYLFDHTMLNCISGRRVDVCFPAKNDIARLDYVDEKEVVGQPDFYIRENQDVYIFECKAIKLNGELKSNPDTDGIIEELSNKLYQKQWKIGKEGKKESLKTPRDEGVGQLVNHIKSIEEGSFKWDSTEKAEFRYYPVLVLENSEIMQSPLSDISNEWYSECLKERVTSYKKKCRPLIVMTIKTLFLYDNYFKDKGFGYYFERFYSECQYKSNDDRITMSPFQSFDEWMTRKYKSQKQNYYVDLIHSVHSAM